MERVSVIGSSGSGKSTMARAIVRKLGLPCLELDAVFHQQGWTPIAEEPFRTEVLEFAAGDEWVIDGNYTSHGVAQLVWPRADTIVWMDPPKRVVMRRVVARTLRRAVTREELWNGNREPLTNLYSTDPQQNIIVWAWTRFDAVRDRYEEMARDGTWDHLDVVRLRSALAAETFVARLGQSGGNHDSS